MTGCNNCAGTGEFLNRPCPKCRVNEYPLNNPERPAIP